MTSKDNMAPPPTHWTKHHQEQDQPQQMHQQELNTGFALQVLSRHRKDRHQQRVRFELLAPPTFAEVQVSEDSATPCCLDDDGGAVFCALPPNTVPMWHVKRTWPQGQIKPHGCVRSHDPKARAGTLPSDVANWMRGTLGCPSHGSE